MRTIYILTPILIGTALQLAIVVGIWRLDRRMSANRRRRRRP